METVKACYRITRKNAIMGGCSAFGTIEYEIDPEPLSPEHRAELVTIPQGGDVLGIKKSTQCDFWGFPIENIDWIDDPKYRHKAEFDIIEILDARIAWRAEHQKQGE
jgi:hypothetical protein